MLILGNIVTAFITVVTILLQIRILVDMITSLANTRINESHPLYVFLMTLTEPFCKPFRRILPANEGAGMTPIFAIITLITCNVLIGGIFKELDKLI